MSLPRYPDYKDSGVEWLGEVPAQWQIVPIKYLVRLQSGGTPAKENETYWDGTLPWASAKDMKTEFLADTEDHITDHAIEEGAAALLDAGVVLIVVRGMILARTFPVTLTRTPMAINQDLKAIIPCPRLVPDFLAWYLRGTADESLGRLDEAGHGTKALRMDAWISLEVTLPAPDEQVTIAAFLHRETEKIDALVAEQEKLIALLKEKRQAVISHAVTKGLDPAAPMKDSGIEWLGEVPAHWGVKQLRYFAEVLRGKFTHRPRNDPAFYDGDFPFIQTGDITGASRYITEYKQTLNERGVSVSKQFPKGTLVMTIAANIGDVAVLDFPAYFPDSIVGLVPRENVELMFMFHLMYAMKRPMLMAATISTQMNLNVDQIVSLSAAQPPMAEQASIVAFLDEQIAKLNALTAEAQHAIDLLKERRAALISAAVTGKIDVRCAVQEQAA